MSFVCACPKNYYGARCQLKYKAKKVALPQRQVEEEEEEQDDEVIQSGAFSRNLESSNATSLGEDRMFQTHTPEVLGSLIFFRSRRHFSTVLMR